MYKRILKIKGSLDPAHKLCAQQAQIEITLNAKTIHSAILVTFWNCRNHKNNLKERKINMKKISYILLIISMVLMLFTACSKDPLAEKFQENNGVLTYTDVENSPFEDSGLQITIQKGETGYCEFYKTDLEGRPIVDYYLFDYENKEVVKYYYVSAMGTGFYYYYDLTDNLLVRLEGEDHTDSTQSAKDAGRWESAEENTKSEINALEDYFKTQFGITIEEAVKNN